MSKKSCLREHFGERRGEREQGLLKLGRHMVYDRYWSLWRELGWKKSFLPMCKVWKMFFNALTCRDKYFLRNRKNLTQPIQMHLCQKQQTLSEFFFFLAFLKSTLNSERFPKKEHPNNWCISEINYSEKRD